MIFASDSSILISFEGGPSLENTQRVLKLFSKLQGSHPAILNLHPAYCSLLVDFDSLKFDAQEFYRFLKAEVQQLKKGRQPVGRNIEMPVCYDGEDLAEVEKQTGLSRQEIVKLHSGQEYIVGFLGFAPGFPYLLGLSEKLQCSRRAVPRLRVPAGSVAIAGGQTGIYPRESPGGWQCIGRTNVSLFDFKRPEPSLIQPGDTVRFIPQPEMGEAPKAVEPQIENITFEIASGGLLSSYQGGPHVGLTHLGVSPGGAADLVALRVGNQLVGNYESATAYENGGLKTVIRFLVDTWFSVTGADCAPTLDQQPIKMWTSLPVSQGQILILNPPKQHLRSYVCVHGGVTGNQAATPPVYRRADVMRELYDKPVHTLTVTYGPQLDWFDYETLTRFFETEFEVGAEINRLGIRLLCEPFVPEDKTELVSEGIANGAIQIAGGGQPMILFCEQQTTGGYPKIVNVIHRDLHWLGQLRPGQKFRVERVDLDQARSLNLQFENTLQKAVDVF